MVYSILLFAVILAPVQSLAGLEIPKSKPGIAQREPVYHPDGILGQMAARARYLYAAASRSENMAVTDWQRYALEVNWIAVKKLSVTVVSEIQKQDSIKYTLLGGFKYYFKDPLSVSGRINPDGSIGNLVVSVLAGSSFYSSVGSKSTSSLELGLILPFSTRLTLSGAYRYLEKTEPFEVSQATLASTYYLSEYPSDSSYINPDGPIGFPAIKISSGGSSNGLFGELAVIFPIKQSLTLRSLLRMERTSNPYQRSLAAGVGLSFYPQRR